MPLFIYDIICSSTFCGITQRMREGGDSKFFLISRLIGYLDLKKEMMPRE